MKRIAFLAALFCGLLIAQQDKSAAPHLIIVSIDGLMPSTLRDAEKLGACPRNSARSTRKPTLLRSTNSSQTLTPSWSASQIAIRSSAATILNEKHSPMPLSGVAWLREAEECYVSGTSVPTPLLLSLFRVARIGE